MSFKIKRFGYTISELQHDLGWGEPIKDKNVRCLSKKTFKSEFGLLKFVSNYLGTQYHKCDWNFDEDLDGDGIDGWVLHIIVDDKMKYATHKMIEEWRESGKHNLVDLLVNVIIEKD